MPSGRVPATGQNFKSVGPIGTHHDRSGKSRPLTVGEIQMARPIFQSSIDYTRVRVHNKEYLWFGIQDDDTAMTPNGEIYFNSKHFKSDFSMEDTVYKLWFMHEMVHVWQYQLGYGVKMAGITTNYRASNVYKYDVKTDTGKKLEDFNFEKQGDIIRNYYGARFLNFDPLGHRKFLESVLTEFLGDPGNAKFLPK